MRDENSDLEEEPGEIISLTVKTDRRTKMKNSATTLRGIMLADYTTLRGIMLAD
jgi:hypothetical protein